MPTPSSAKALSYAGELSCTRSCIRSFCCADEESERSASFCPSSKGTSVAGRAQSVSISGCGVRRSSVFALSEGAEANPLLRVSRVVFLVPKKSGRRVVFVFEAATSRVRVCAPRTFCAGAFASRVSNTAGCFCFARSTRSYTPERSFVLDVNISASF